MPLVCLLAPSVVTNVGPTAAGGTPSRRQSQREWNQPQIGLVFALWYCDKKITAGVKTRS
jgi:hypothetical protein